MQRKFLTNLLFLIFVNLLIKPFYIFGIDRTVQVTVGTADYGLYAVLYNFSILYYILLDLGLSNYNNRTIAQQPHLLKSYLPNFLIIKTLLSFLYLCLSVIALKPLCRMKPELLACSCCGCIHGTHMTFLLEKSQKQE